MREEPRILVVDDDPAVRRSLAGELEGCGYRVDTATNGREAEEASRSHRYDVILTDLAMPAADGFALISAVRPVSDVPIIVLSVRDQESEKVRALDLGADDFVSKPFSVPELLARVRAQIRRSTGRGTGEILRFPGLTIDLDRRRVVQGEREVRLTPTEFALLALFARHAGRPLTFRAIAARVWPGGTTTSPDTIRVHVGSLRRKIEPDPSRPGYIVTEPWVGYRFIAEPL